MKNEPTESSPATERLQSFIQMIPAIVCAKIEGKPTARIKMAIMEDAVGIGLDEKDKFLLSQFLSATVVTEGEAGALLELSQSFRPSHLTETAVVQESIMAACARIFAILEPAPTTSLSRTKAAVLQGVALLLRIGDYPALSQRMGHLLGRRVPVVSASAARNQLAILISGKRNPAKANKWSYGELVDLLPVTGITLTLQPGVRLNQKRFVKLVAGSISLSKAEKVQILHATGRLEQRKLRELANIFKQERTRFQELAFHHAPQLEQMENKVALDWLELWQEYR